MSGYVLVRDDGKFVSRSGSAHSYTKLLQEAHIYETRQAAEDGRCPENECVVALATILGRSL